MTYLEINRKLGPVYQALNELSVSGRENIGRLYASLGVIEEILRETARAAQELQEES